MAEIDHRVSAWRASVARKFPRRDDVLDEFEAHLRDEVEQRMQAGDSLDGAFRLAAAKLGEPDALAAEFSKVPLHDVPWLPIRLVWIASTLLAGWLVKSLTPRFTAGGVDTLLAVHMGAITLGYLATLSIGLLAVCHLTARLFRDVNPGQVRSLNRHVLLLAVLASALTGLGVTLGSFCPLEKTGAFWGWSAHEIGGLAILAWNVLTLLMVLRNRYRVNRVDRLMLAGIVGNALVLVGWLGAIAIENHAHGISLPAVMMLLLVQFAIGCTVFAPAGCLRGVRS